MFRKILESLTRLTSSIVRHHSIEREILAWLEKKGYRSQSTQFHEVELHAIQAPGWLQIFRFHIEVKNNSLQLVQLYGALRSDERYGASRIQLFEVSVERDLQLNEWSEGLIVRRAKKR
jgi:hypothetical protein